MSQTETNNNQKENKQPEHLPALEGVAELDLEAALASAGSARLFNSFFSLESKTFSIIIKYIS